MQGFRQKPKKNSSLATEHEDQVALFQWLGLTYPEVAVFAIPNGGKRNLLVAAKLKLEGVKAGVPDIFVAEPCGAAHGLFIELKRERGGSVSDNQKRWRALLLERGYQVAICHGLKAAQEIISGYLDGAN
ncbi:MAG: VRR-NUC domain-containing protein [Deltaproteobacteria bacterium]|jgi:hypothetical protein|nr:VRR-NUC domain-containing protein [Deltaproteobacteria bacterium]